MSRSTHSRSPVPSLSRSRSPRPSSRSPLPNSRSPRPTSRSSRPNSRSPVPPTATNSRSSRPNSRSPVPPNSRSSRPNSRSPVPNSRSPRPNSRSPLPNSRSPLPNSMSLLPPSAEHDSTQLQQTYLEGVVKTGEVLGKGCLGHVIEVKYNGHPYAAKIISEKLVDPRNQKEKEVIEKECLVMKNLRHPNITQLLGYCHLEESDLPVLIMERLHMSVEDILEYSCNLPLPVKLSILTDTCKGLAYLHGLESPIIHGDLTARNVLLTKELTAKIADLGNFCIHQLRPSQLAQTLTRHPGTAVYMAPEVFCQDCKYGPHLDIFSFGHLTLYILTQILPFSLLPSLQGRTEVQRRQAYMSSLEEMYGHCQPAFIELVKQCLHSSPERRPSAQDLLRRLNTKENEVKRKYGDDMKNDVDKNKILEIKVIETLSSVEELKSKNKLLEAANEAKNDEKKRLESELEKLQKQRDEMQGSIPNSTVTVAIKEQAAALLQLQRMENEQLLDLTSKLENDISIQQNSMDRLRDENDDMKMRLALLEVDSQRVKVGKENIEELKAKLHQLSNEKEELEEKVKDNRSQTELLWLLKEELDVKNQQLEESKDELAQNEYSLELALKKLENPDRQKSDGDFKKIKDQQDQLRARNNDLIASNKKLESEKAAFTNTLKKIEEDNANRMVVSEEMMEKAKEQAALLQRLEKDSTINELELLRLKKETSEHESSLKVIQNENSKLQTTLSKISAEHHTELYGLTKERDSLQQQLHEKEQQILENEKLLETIHQNTGQPTKSVAAPHLNPSINKPDGSMSPHVQKIGHAQKYDAPLVGNQSNPSILNYSPSFSEARQRTHQPQQKWQTSSDHVLPKKKSMDALLPLRWNCVGMVPHAINGCVQAVSVNGIVYIGGGKSENFSDSFKVMAFDPRSSTWDSFRYHTWCFTMASFNNRLVLLSGFNRQMRGSKSIGVWLEENKEWMAPYPPMLTSRLSPSVTSFKQWLVVAGGYDHNSLSSVEILDTRRNKWFAGPSMPISIQKMPSITIGDVWYIFNDGQYNSDLYSVSLHDLIYPRAYGKAWRQVSSLNYNHSSLFSFEGSLFALGGQDYEEKSVSTIQRYVPVSNSWVPVGQLPYNVNSCACTLSQNTLYIIGWQGSKLSLFYSPI